FQPIRFWQMEIGDDGGDFGSTNAVGFFERGDGGPGTLYDTHFEPVYSFEGDLQRFRAGFAILDDQGKAGHVRAGTCTRLCGASENGAGNWGRLRVFAAGGRRARPR